MQNWCIFMRLVSRPKEFSHWPRCITPHFETFAAVSKHCVVQTSPRSALPEDTTTMVDKDGNFTIMTSEM